MNKEHNGKQRDRPRLRDRLWGWVRLWGADAMLVCGAGCVSVGVGWWVCPPAGLIAAGVLLIAGGVLWARGGGVP